MLPNLGPMEMMVVGVVAVLLFGRRLPEVGRSLGKGIVEFKKGIRGIEDDVDTTPKRSSSLPKESSYSSETVSAPSVPKFEPPTTAPVASTNSSSDPYQN